MPPVMTKLSNWWFFLFSVNKYPIAYPWGQAVGCLHELAKRVVLHDNIIKWKHFPCYWPFVQGIHRSPVNSSHKGQWHGALMFSLIYAWLNSWVNNRKAGDLRCHPAHHDVIVMGKEVCATPVSAGLFHNTVECYYNSVRYNKTLHTSLQW